MDTTDNPTLDQPVSVDRICEQCQLDGKETKLILDFTVPGHEYRCPVCGRFEQWFGARKP